MRRPIAKLALVGLLATGAAFTATPAEAEEVCLTLNLPNGQRLQPDCIHLADWIGDLIPGNINVPSLG